MHILTTSPVARRGFLARLSAAAGAAALLGAPQALRAEPAPRAAAGPGPDDPDAWIGRLTGRDRLLIHAHEQLGTALAAAHGVLRDGQGGYGVPEAENSVAVAVHGRALGGVLTDASWQRFALGERYKLQAPGGGAVTTNPYLRPRPDEPPEAVVPALMQRGVTFVACDVAVRNLARRIAGEGKPWEEVHRELVAGVVPGVFVVPNVFVAISHGQKQGVGYLYIG